MRGSRPWEVRNWAARQRWMARGRKSMGPSERMLRHLTLPLGPADALFSMFPFTPEAHAAGEQCVEFSK